MKNGKGLIIIDTDGKQCTLFDLFVICLSFVSIFIILLELIVTASPEMKRLLSIVDNVICLFFITDFIIDFYSAKNKLKFMKLGWIDLLASIPSFGGIGRITKIIRLLRSFKAISSLLIIVKSIKTNRNNDVAIALMCSFIVIILASILILHAENTPTANIKTAEDAIWWVFCTITTVGYGDKFPVTTIGRMIGVVTMIVGITVFSLVTAHLATNIITNKNTTNEEDKR